MKGLLFLLGMTVFSLAARAEATKMDCTYDVSTWEKPVDHGEFSMNLQTEEDSVPYGELGNRDIVFSFIAPDVLSIMHVKNGLKVTLAATYLHEGINGLFYSDFNPDHSSAAHFLMVACIKK